ncbi:MAG: glycerophosphodiester phosphodiesterase [Solirubrobacteraceae bacterium]
MGDFQRIGHGGASALAPANTLASFDAALEVGVDMVEFDLRAWRGELVLAHTVLHARLGALCLDRALRHLAGRHFDGVAVNVDLKDPGCEAALLDALHQHRLLGRVLISSQVPAVLDRLRARDPRTRTAISVGGRIARISQRWGDWRAKVLADLAVRRWDGLMAQHRLVDGRLLDAVAERGGALYAWTVNDRDAIGALRELGVHGVATADPRLFAPG